MMPAGRRAFFQNLLALTAAPALGPAAIRRPVNPSMRAQQALALRESAAVWEAEQPVGAHPTNGDESRLPSYAGSFTKGLPHTQLGEVEPGTYETLLYALSTGKQADFEALDRGSGAKLVSPLAAYAFQLEGADSHRLGMDAPFSFTSADQAGEMVELYWQALARDVPFSDYATSPVAQAAVHDLNSLSAFHGPKESGKVTTNSLFRGSIAGSMTGPYISQFFWQPVPVNSTTVHQLYQAGAPRIDYLTTWDEWLVIQSGLPPYRPWTPAARPTYIYNGRSLAEWVHYDFVYQAYHNAALILLNQSPESVLNYNPYLNPTNPYKSTRVETGFATFGAPHICCLLGTVCQAALLAAWHQKWLVHRRGRPEEFGGKIHQSVLGHEKYPIHGDVLNSAALKALYAANNSYLLPQAYPEGCPLHPAYPSGHATVSGACSAVLKAFFDETQILTNCVVASADGGALTPYYDQALTVGGEINKLAFNVAMGRDFAGIHWRSDAEAGIRLGEDVAIAMLQDYVNCFAETFSGFSFTRVDGTPVRIRSSGT